MQMNKTKEILFWVVCFPLIMLALLFPVCLGVALLVTIIVKIIYDGIWGGLMLVVALCIPLLPALLIADFKKPLLVWTQRFFRRFFCFTFSGFAIYALFNRNVLAAELQGNDIGVYYVACLLLLALSGTFAIMGVFWDITLIRRKYAIKYKRMLVYLRKPIRFIIRKHSNHKSKVNSSPNKDAVMIVSLLESAVLNYDNICDVCKVNILKTMKRVNDDNESSMVDGELEKAILNDASICDAWKIKVLKLLKR